MWSVRIALARFRPFDGATIAKIVIVALLVASFLAGDYVVFRKVFHAARSVETATPIFAAGVIQNFLELVLLVGFFVLFFSSLTSAIGAFFLDLDLETQHSAPRRKASIVFSRWMKTYVQSAYVVALFLSPIFFALRADYSLQWRTVAIDIAALLLLLAIPVSAASLVIVLLVRFFPVRRVQQIAASLAILCVSVAVIGVRMARPERLFSDVKTDDVVQVLKQIELPSADRYPSSWVAEIAMADQSGASVAEYATKVVSSSGAAFLIFFLIATPLYFRAWVRAKESQAPVAIGGTLITRSIDALTCRFSGPMRALIGKEVRVLIRDAAQWSQLFMMLALLFLYLYNIQMMPLEGDARAVLLAYLNLGMAGFVVAAIALRFAYPSVSAEGKAFWILESAPLSYRALLWIKTVVYTLPLLGVTLLLTILANAILHAPGEVWFYTVGGAMLMTITLVALGVGMGGASPSFKHENPMEVALSLGGFGYMAVSLSYCGMMMLLLARPTQRIFFRLAMGIDTNEHRVIGITPLIVAVVVSMLLIVLPLEIAQRRLAARGER